MREKRLSRRSFLRRAAAFAGMATLASFAAACGATPTPKVVEKVVEKEVTKIVAGTPVKEIVKETVVVEKKVEVPAAGKIAKVKMAQASWAVQEVPMDAQARLFNEKHPNAQVTIQTHPPDVPWTTKYLQQIQDGTIDISAAGIMSAPHGLIEPVVMQLMQPMEQFVKASSEPGAQDMEKDMIKIVWDSNNWRGHLWAIPYSFENISYNWRTDYYRRVGWEKAPVTWAEKKQVAQLLKKELAKEQVVPFSWIMGMHTDFMADLQAMTKEPYGVVDGMKQRIKFDSPEGIETFNYMRSFLEEDLTPPHGFDDWWPLYQKGKLACVQAQSSRGVWGQKIFGQANVMTSPIPEKTVGAGCGNMYWTNSTGILNKAPCPQEATDFLIFMLGPQNVAFQKTVIESGKTPVYESIYREIIEKDPAYETYKWMVPMRKQVENSYPRPRQTYYYAESTAYNKWIVKFMEKGSAMKAEEVAKSIIKEATDEINKQKFRFDPE